MGTVGSSQQTQTTYLTEISQRTAHKTHTGRSQETVARSRTRERMGSLYLVRMHSRLFLYVRLWLSVRAIKVTHWQKGHPVQEAGTPTPFLYPHENPSLVQCAFSRGFMHRQVLYGGADKLLSAVLRVIVPHTRTQWISGLLQLFVYVEFVTLRMCPDRKVSYTISWHSMPEHAAKKKKRLQQSAVVKCNLCTTRTLTNAQHHNSCLLICAEDMTWLWRNEGKMCRWANGETVQ